MNGEKENKGIRQYVVPVLAATAIMVLVLLTIPITGIPAKVMGGYGDGGSASPISPALGQVGFSVTGPIDMTTPGTATVVISGLDYYSVNLLTLTFAGASLESWYMDANGNLVLVFDKSKMNLKPGDTLALLSGSLKDGKPFSGSVPVVVQ